MNEERLRQRSLLDDGLLQKPLPKEVEEQALDLLVQLLIAVIPVIEGGHRDEQDHQ